MLNIIIINNTINTTNTEIKNYSSKISKGDNKNLLYTLPYIPFTENGWITICYEDLIMNTGTVIEKIQTYLNTTQNIEKILFFRANTFIVANWEEIKNLNVYKIIYVDDIHNSREIYELRALDKELFNYFDLILSTYAYCFNKFFKYVPKEKIYWFPHSSNEIFKIDYNHNPLNKILLSGCICETYPMRQKLLSLENKYSIDVLQHPSYSKNKSHNIIGMKFIEKINEYRFAFTCYSYYYTPYIIQKYFEIPGSGALLIASDYHIKKQMTELGFIDMVNYISVNESNLEEKIIWLFDESNNQIIEEIRLNGYNFVNSNHTHTIRTRQFLNYLSNFEKS